MQCHDVHIWLFLAMVSHFLMSTMLIFSCTDRQRKIREIENSGDDLSFNRTRQVFIDHYKGQNHPGMDDDFCFSLYMSLNIDRILSDFCNFHVSAWIVLLIIKVLECGIVALLDLDGWAWHDGFILSLCVAVLSPLACVIEVWANKRSLEEIHQSKCFPAKEPDSCWAALGEKYDLEIWHSRMFQALTFTLSYEFMRCFASKNFWKGYYTTDWPHSKDADITIWILTLIVLVIVNVCFLSQAIKLIARKYSLPPYVDEVHVLLLLRCY